MGTIVCVILILTPFNIEKCLVICVDLRTACWRKRWDDVYLTAKITLLFVQFWSIYDVICKQAWNSAIKLFCCVCCSTCQDTVYHCGCGVCFCASLSHWPV